jgi:hypothetical protein
MRLLFFSAVCFLLLCKHTDGQTLYPTAAGGVGAVYTMSNGAKMNQILIQRLNANGQLTVVGAVNTNGTGVNITTPDALFSQDSLTVYSNYLFAVNPGSNSLSMFMINPADATQLTLLSVQPTFGWFPVSVAVNSMYACVLTGGNITGVRCFTYNSSGLYVVPSFDQNLTSYISQSVPPVGPSNTMSEILFSADNLTLAVTVKGVNATMSGYLILFSLTNNYTMLSSPFALELEVPIWPYSMTLVGSNGLLITDPGTNSILTLTYSSMNGSVNNVWLTVINSSLVSALCYSTYSPTIGDYYVISVTGAILELSVNFSSSTDPVEIVQFYETPPNDGALDATVVTLAGQDYLYVLGATAYVINGYQLNAPGNATLNTMVVVEAGNTTNIPALAGIAAFVQTQSSSPSTPSSSTPSSSSPSSSLSPSSSTPSSSSPSSSSPSSSTPSSSTPSPTSSTPSSSSIPSSSSPSSSTPSSSTPSSAAASFFTSTITIMICIVFIYIGCK